MAFSSISLYKFRNLYDDVVDLDSDTVFLIGKNAQGKTNFLEAIYLLCYGSSFRTRSDMHLCRNGDKSMSVQGTFSSIEKIEQSVSVQVEKGRKIIRLNGKRIVDRKELLSNTPCIVFSHEDISFVQGPPERMRWFFNQTLSLYNILFIDTLRKYRKILGLRNQCLKEGDSNLLSIYDQQLSIAGQEIQNRRNSIVSEFNNIFIEHYRTIAEIPGDLRIVYKSSWKPDGTHDEIVAGLRSKRAIDQSLGITTSGPHRDRFVFSLGNRDFSKVASTGQLRLISILLRIAQAVFFIEQSAKMPILLVDDVLLELDEEKRKKVIENLPPCEQAVFTFLPDEKYLQYGNGKARIYKVSAGKLVEL